MTTCYVHIGIHKTGTKSIQNTFYFSRKTLLARDINYLPIAINHSVDFYSLLADEPHLYIPNVQQGIDTPRKAERHNVKLREKITNELQANESGKLIISGEDLSSLSRSGVESLKALLEPYAGTTRIIVYVRSPIEFALSAAQERLKHGDTLEKLLDVPHVPEYRFRIEKYMQVFGRENVDIRTFDPGRFPHGSLVADFCTAIDEPAELVRELRELRANEAMSLEAALLLNELNKVRPILKDQRYNRERALGVAEWIADVAGTRFSLPPEFFERVRDLVREDVAWLRDVAGIDAFSRMEPDSEPVAAAWGEATLQSLALKLNQAARLEQQARMRRAARRRRNGFGTPRWLRRAAMLAGLGRWRTGG